MGPMEAHSWMLGMIDQAFAAAVAQGVPCEELWTEHRTDRVEVLLMRGAALPEIGEVSTGTPIARVWMDGLELRYEGIELGAGWTAPGGRA